MALVGIWERGNSIAAALEAAMESRADFISANKVRAVNEVHNVDFIHAAHPAGLAEQELALLVAAPDAQGWGGAGVLHCRVALVPSAAGPRAGTLKAGSAVSYGTSPKSSITLSSLEGDKIVLALQRELVTISGAVLERQELVLPFRPGTDPDHFLCLTGALLLLDVPVEKE